MGKRAMRLSPLNFRADAFRNGFPSRGSKGGRGYWEHILAYCLRVLADAL